MAKVNWKSDEFTPEEEENFNIDDDDDFGNDEDDEFAGAEEDSGDEFDDLEENVTEGQKTSNKSFGAAFSTALSKILEKPNESAKVLAECKAPLENIDKELLERKIREELVKRKNQRINKNHFVVENYSTYELEKKLSKTATRGVVKLFNAVNKHQKIINKERKKDKKGKLENLSKEKFFELLKSTGEKNEEEVEEDEENTNENLTERNISNTKVAPSSWSVLSDNYMLKNQRLRDWDKELEEEEEMEQEMEKEIPTSNFGDDDDNDEF